MFVIWIFVTSVIFKGILATHDISRIPTYVLGPKPTETARPPVNKAQNRRVYETVYTAPTTTERPLNPRYGGGLVPDRRRSRFKPQYVDRNRERAMQRVRAQTTPRPTTQGLGGGIALEPWFRAAATAAPRQTWDQSYNQQQQQQSNSNRWNPQHTPTETSGVWREADMYRTDLAQPTQQSMSGLLAGMDSNRGITALYSFDTGHGHDTVQQQNSVPATSNQVRSRFRVLPNGSIVDYGTSNSGRRRKQRPKVVQPTGQPTTTRGRLGVGRVTTGKTRPSTTVRDMDPVAGGIAIPGIVPTAAESRGFAVNDKIPTMPVSPSEIPQVETTAMHASTTTAKKQRGGGQGSWSRSRSRHFNNAKSHDDPGYWETLPGAAGGQRRRVEYNFDSSSLTNRSFLIGETFAPPTTTKRPTTTTTIVTTTTTPTTTTPTTTTTTTTQKPVPTTSKWGFNGGEPINITFLNDEHVCPASRARWQDYTVYLETKPRLCMIQITWNARYKQEPIYHNSWWGQDVEWVYKTVYDPTVEFLDRHTTG